MTKWKKTANRKSQDPEQVHIAHLIKQLGDRDTARRDQAEHALHSLGPTAVQPLLAAVANAARWRRYWQIFTVVLIGLAIASKVHKYVRHGVAFDDFMTFLPVLLCLAGLPKATERQRRLIQVLSGIDDRRAIGPFAEALGFTYREDSNLVQEALIRFLPQLQASDAALLSEKQRANLHRALQGKDSPLSLVILKAFEQVGDARDLVCVEAIDSPDPEVMEAAQACLPYLRKRIQQQQISQTLLRACGPATLTPDVLLRPATAQEPVETQTLLRAASNPTDANFIGTTESYGRRWNDRDSSRTISCLITPPRSLFLGGSRPA